MRGFKVLSIGIVLLVVAGWLYRAAESDRALQNSLSKDVLAEIPPEEAAKRVVSVHVGEENLESWTFNERLVNARFVVVPLSDGLAQRTIELAFIDILCGLRAIDLGNRSIALGAYLRVSDQSGSSKLTEAIETEFSPSAYARLDCNAQSTIDLAALADSWHIGPILQ